MASIKELLSAMISKINGKNEGVDWNENDPDSPAFVKNRPFYDTRKFSQEIAIDGYKTCMLCKISDNVPEQLTGSESVYLWSSTGYSLCIQLIPLSENIYAAYKGIPYVVIATSDGASESLTEFNFGPLERGVYFMHFGSEGYVSGVSFTGADTPEITWDGDIGTIKQIDPKYITSVIITKNGENYTANCTFDEFAELVKKGANVILRDQFNDGYDMINATRISKKDSEARFTIYFDSYTSVYFSTAGVEAVPM